MTALTYDAALLAAATLPEPDIGIGVGDTVNVSMVGSTRDFKADVEAMRCGMVLVRHCTSRSLRWVYEDECRVILKARIE